MDLDERQAPTAQGLDAAKLRKGPGTAYGLSATRCETSPSTPKCSVAIPPTVHA